MPRKHRIVISGRPHHVIQRGNRRQKVFFYPGDKEFYLQLLREKTVKYGVQIWAYCLMDNHVHFILVPSTADGLAKSVAETNCCFTRMINARNTWHGYLWQGRFISSVMDDIYLVRTLRYVENNPVRAKMVAYAEDYPWSSARAHVRGVKDPLLSPCPVSGFIGDWKIFLRQDDPEGILDDIRRRNRAGLPMGEDVFIKELAAVLGKLPQDLLPREAGRPRK